MTAEPAQDGTESSHPDPWEQLPDEPDRDYARFVTYLGLRDRRRGSATAALDLSEPRLKGLRARWRWKDRAAAYDKAQAEEILATTVRLRNEAAASVLDGILSTANALRETPDEERDPKGLQSLAAAIRSLTPVTEVTVSSSGAAGPDVVEVAFRRAQQMRAGQESSGADG